ncbi:MAG: thioesterase family protein [Phototrophicaceae bacterium]
MLDSGLRVGLIGEAIDTVKIEQTAIRMGSGAFEVFATPSLIALMESAAVAAIAPNLPQDYASVGIEVHIKHISATPVGENVVAMAEVTRIDDKRVYLEVRAWDEEELIGIGTHTRYIIEISDFENRLQRPSE